MAKNSQFITYGKGPEKEDTVWYAPFGTEIDNDPFKVPATAAIGLGFVSDEGDTETPGYGESEAQYDQCGTPVIYSDGEYAPLIALSLLQSGNDFEVDKVVYGEQYVTGTKDNYQIVKNASNKSVGVVVVDHEFENGARERAIYPNATIKLSDDIQNTYTDLRVLPVTITPAMDPETGMVGVVYKKSKADTQVQG